MEPTTIIQHDGTPTHSLPVKQVRKGDIHFDVFGKHEVIRVTCGRTGGVKIKTDHDSHFFWNPEHETFLVLAR